MTPEETTNALARCQATIIKQDARIRLLEAQVSASRARLAKARAALAQGRNVIVTVNGVPCKKGP